MSDGSSNEDYDAFEDAGHLMEKRFPLHDCVEFEDIEALRKLIYYEVEEEEPEGKETKQDDSSSDENDSTAAAHAAAIGHSPQPIKPNPEKDQQEAKYDEESKAQAPDKSDSQKPNDAAKMDVDNIGLAPSGQSETTGESEASTHQAPDVDGETVNVGSQETSKADKGKADGAKKQRVRKKLEKDPDVHLNERDEDENTALHIAIISKKLDHVKLLLEAGASFRLRCDGSLPLHTAISMGSVSQNRQFAYECFVALHEHGADLAAKDDTLHTPLFLTCMFNLPQITSYILSDDEGLSTLNTRSDRTGSRPLHAAARFDTLENPSLSKSAAASATEKLRPHHHPDGSVVNSLHSIPGVSGKASTGHITAPSHDNASRTSATEALMTQVLLGTNGIEVDAVNVMGRTPLHIACSRGNWSVVRLLIQAGASTSVTDRRGYTPGQLAYKKGMPIPNDLIDTLGGLPETGTLPPIRDLIVDPDGRTMLICHELCLLHRTCAPMRRNAPEPPPENVRRLQVLVDPQTGILRGGEFSSLLWKKDARRVAISDVLKVHDYNYVETISRMTSSIPDHPNAIANLDGDTAISRWSYEAALRAAGSVCDAVDKVLAGDVRNAFCAVRPPGHHAGPRGIVKCANDPEGGSHGFCLLNNVAIGAAYARSMYRNEGIQRIAIVDFDVHHGNGTEEIIRQLVPNTERTAFRTPYAMGELSQSTYRPWLDETDVQNVFFSSTHGYGNRGYDQPGWFYPASGKTQTSDALAHPAMVETPNLTDFLLSQTWARMGEDSKTNCCKIINVGLELPEQHADPQSRSMRQRLELRDTYRKKIFPHLREFDPDLIFISAGFDAHRRDTMNFGYVGMVEDDYEWVTEQLVKIANTCCKGRIISVLEGGYKIHGGIISPFARSVASHVRALVDGGKSRELYDMKDCEWESTFEHHLFEKRERKKEQEREHLRAIELGARRSLAVVDGDAPEDPDAPSRKRRRNQVDYKELYKQMQQEGFGN